MTKKTPRAPGDPSPLSIPVHLMSATQRNTRPFTLVVGADFSDLSHRAVGTALTLAGVAGRGDVHLVHAMTLPEVASELGVVAHDVFGGGSMSFQFPA